MNEQDQIAAFEPPLDCIVMPRELTAENGAKAVMMGEFSQCAPVFCPDCNGSDEREACLTCAGKGTVSQCVNISWTNIKAIYAMAVKHLGHNNQGEPGATKDD